ncbi:hypothetical protein KKC60_05395 [Patescibacteria group bacterium]|nr:hypothetical protein [Patescibacteria group bacterium]
MPESSATIIEHLQEVCQGYLVNMGVEGEVRARIDFDTENEQELIVLNIESEEASLLIGQGGNHLLAFQHLLRATVQKKTNTFFKFTLDINDYRKERKDFLESLAHSLAEKALREGEEIEMRPMSSFERRVVHKAVAERSEVETESRGVEPERRVVIKPKRSIPV